MKKVTHYIIVRAYGHNDLETAVNQRIKEGYIPTGGMQIIPTSGEAFQAMIKMS